jgi:hypothetical protein
MNAALSENNHQLPTFLALESSDIQAKRIMVFSPCGRNCAAYRSPMNRGFAEVAISMDRRA